MSDITANDEFYNHKMAILDLENEMRGILAKFNIDASNMEIYEMAKLLKDVKGGISPGFGLKEDAEGNAAVDTDVIASKEYFDTEVGAVGPALDELTVAINYMLGIEVPAYSVRNCGVAKYNGDYADSFSMQLGYPYYYSITNNSVILYFHSRYGWTLGTTSDNGLDADFAMGAAPAPIGGTWYDVKGLERAIPEVTEPIPAPPPDFNCDVIVHGCSAPEYNGGYLATGEYYEEMPVFYNDTKFGTYLSYSSNTGWYFSKVFSEPEFVLPDSTELQLPAGDFIDATGEGRTPPQAQLFFAAMFVSGCSEQKYNGSWDIVDKINEKDYYGNYNGEAVFLFFDLEKGWSFGTSLDDIDFAVNDPTIDSPYGAVFIDLKATDDIPARNVPVVQQTLKRLPEEEEGESE